MKINVRVITKAKQNNIVEEGENRFKVWLIALPVDNKANQELIKILAKYFKIKKSQIEITSGHKNRDKIINLAI